MGDNEYWPDGTIKEEVLLDSSDEAEEDDPLVYDNGVPMPDSSYGVGAEGWRERYARKQMEARQSAVMAHHRRQTRRIGRLSDWRERYGMRPELMGHYRMINQQPPIGKRQRKRITNDGLEHLITEVECHPQMYRGWTGVGLADANSKRLKRLSWEDAAFRLNQVTKQPKTLEEWKQTWNSLVRRVSQKHRLITSGQAGSSSTPLVLSELESRVLAIVTGDVDQKPDKLGENGEASNDICEAVPSSSDVIDGEYFSSELRTGNSVLELSPPPAFREPSPIPLQSTHIPLPPLTHAPMPAPPLNHAPMPKPLLTHVPLPQPIMEHFSLPVAVPSPMPELSSTPPAPSTYGKTPKKKGKRERKLEDAVDVFSEANVLRARKVAAIEKLATELPQAISQVATSLSQGLALLAEAFKSVAPPRQ